MLSTLDAETENQTTFQTEERNTSSFLGEMLIIVFDINITLFLILCQIFFLTLSCFNH